MFSTASLNDLVPELVSIRRHLHARPELRFEEKETAAYVAGVLEKWGVPVVRDLGGHGLVAVLKRGSSTRSIGLRADMDALPVTERNRFAHVSQHPGRMHACGHDGHTAMLLGAARYLVENGGFDGTVNFIFQPAEEGGAGAKLMIEDGLFDRCPMDAVFGMHNWPGMPAGAFGVRPDGIMASSNTFSVTIRGRGAHAAQPHRSVDPVMVAVQIAQAWQTIVSRNVNPNDSAVLSITQIQAGSAVNVIPEDAELKGTVRTFSMDVLDLVEQRMRTIAESIAAAFDATVEFTLHRMYPAVVNHANEAAFAADVMRGLVGAERVDDNVERGMTAEDFSFYLQQRPGCYVFIGNGEPKPVADPHGAHPGCPLHNAHYDFNDDILPVGASYWVALARAYLPAA